MVAVINRRKLGVSAVCVSLVAAVMVAPTGMVTTALANPATPQVTVAPDLESAQAAARAQGSRVEVSSLDTDTSTTWVNADGTLTSDISSTPVHVRDASGQWQKVDDRLRRRSDGVVVPAVSASGVEFGDVGDKAVARLDAPRGPAGFDWGRSLPAPTLSGDTATYPQVFSGTNLTSEATATGFEVSLVVSSASSAAALPGSMDLPLSGAGLTWAVTPQGVLAGTDDSGALVVSSSGARAWDASRDPHTDEPLRSVPLTMSVDGGPGAQVLHVAMPKSLLADPATVYPVTIDPSTSWAKTAWTYVDSGFPTTSYYNVNDVAKVGTFNSGGDVDRSMFQFATANLAGKHVLSATITLNETWSWSCTPRQFNITSVIGSFNSATTWNNQPATGMTYASITAAKGYSASCPAGNVSADFTTWARAAAGNGNTYNSIELKAASEADNTYWKKFNPAVSISVTYNSYPGSPVGRSISPCGGGCVSPVVSNTLTPQLTGGTSDPDGGTLRYDYEVWAGWSASPTALVAYGSVSGVPSGQGSAWNVPAGALVNGGAYEYRVRAFDGTDYGPWSNGWAIWVVDIPVVTGLAVDHQVSGANVRTTCANGQTVTVDGTQSVSLIASLSDPAGYAIHGNFAGTGITSVSIAPAGGGASGDAAYTIPRYTYGHGAVFNFSVVPQDQNFSGAASGTCTVVVSDLAPNTPTNARLAVPDAQCGTQAAPTMVRGNQPLTFAVHVTDPNNKAMWVRFAAAAEGASTWAYDWPPNAAANGVFNSGTDATNATNPVSPNTFAEGTKFYWVALANNQEPANANPWSAASPPCWAIAGATPDRPSLTANGFGVNGVAGYAGYRQQLTITGGSDAYSKVSFAWTDNASVQWPADVPANVPCGQTAGGVHWACPTSQTDPQTGRLIWTATDDFARDVPGTFTLSVRAYNQVGMKSDVYVTDTANPLRAESALSGRNHGWLTDTWTVASPPPAPTTITDSRPDPGAKTLNLNQVDWVDGGPIGSGGALSFTAANSSTATTTGSAIDINNGFSMSVTVEVTGTGEQAILSQDGAAGASSVYLGVKNIGGVDHYAFCLGSTCTAPLDAASALPTGGWDVLAGAYDASNNQLRLYLGGFLAATASMPSAPTAVDGTFAVGRGLVSGAPGLYLTGLVQDPAVYLGALSEADAQSLIGPA